MAKFDSAKKFLSHLKEQTPSPRYALLSCGEHVRIDPLVREITKHLFPSDIRKSLETVRMRGKDLKQRELVRFLDDTKALSLFAQARLFWIRDADQIPAASLDDLLSALHTCSPEIAIVFTCNKIPATHKLRKMLQKDSLFLELKPLEGADLKRWTIARLRAAGVTRFETRVPELLMEIGDHSPDRIAPLAEHIALYAGDALIEEKHLFEVFITHPHPNEFTLIDVIARKDVAQVEKLIQELLSTGKSPFLLVSMLGRTIANYIALGTLQDEGKSPTQIQTQLGLKPWVIKKTTEALRHYPKWKREKLMYALLKADGKLKNKSLGPAAILSELAYEMRP
ncbi:MAG: DNA polymerase III subunit delta [Bdellovibrionales bacterium]|nr:DNA polymerase III subunit delta [Bdellovibrionales bacterium]